MNFSYCLLNYELNISTIHRRTCWMKRGKKGLILAAGDGFSLKKIVAWICLLLISQQHTSMKSDHKVQNKYLCTANNTICEHVPHSKTRPTLPWEFLEWLHRLSEKGSYCSRGEREDKMKFSEDLWHNAVLSWAWAHTKCLFSCSLAKTTNICKFSAHLRPVYQNLVNTTTHFYPLLLFSLDLCSVLK